MAFLRSHYDSCCRVLGELAERWAGPQDDAGDRWRSVRIIIAERLILLAAGATFIVAPACLVSSGLALPGTYGAAAAIALVFITVPFLALGSLAMSAAPWRVALAAASVWAVLTGAMISVSPLIAIACGAVLFFSAAVRDIGQRIDGEAGHPVEEVTEPVQADGGRGEGVSLCLACDGTVRNVSNAGAETFRAGLSFIDRVHLADRIAVMTAMNDSRHGRDSSVRVSARVDLAKRGRVQSYEQCSIVVEPMENGLRVSVARQGEQAATATTEHDADSIARQRFLATVSHELRTPLNSIIGFSDILRGDIFGALANERQREYVNLIHSSGNHLLSIVNTILDVSKLNAGTYAIHRESFDLNHTVDECIAMLEPQARQKSISVSAGLDSGISEADGDRRAIRQVIINVLSNAIKFTRDGGDVIVTTAKRANGYEISVRDDGIGMTPDELRQVGKPFIQADNDYTRSCEGTGLGLTVVNGLVALHGGTVDIQSREGDGTRISIFIPDAGSGLPHASETELRDARKPDVRQVIGTVGQMRKDDGDAVRIAV